MDVIRKICIVIILIFLYPQICISGKVSPALVSFTRGELSPFLYSRIDLQSYNLGLKKEENFIVLPYGGAMRRPGTYYVAETKDSTKKSRLIPFQFSTEQAYILEFGDKYIRFYKDDGQILDGGAPYEIISPYGEDDLFEIQYAQDADTMYLCHPDYPIYKLTREGHTSWRLSPFLPSNVVEPSFGFYTGGWTSGLEGSKTYDGDLTTICQTNTNTAYIGVDFGIGNEKDIRKIRLYGSLGTYNFEFTLQYSDDGITYTDSSVVTQTIPYRSGWNSFPVTSVGAHRYWRLDLTGSLTYWQLTEFELYEYNVDWIMPFMPQNKTSITLTPSATTGSINLTASSAIFSSDYVGTMFKLHDGIVLVTEYTSTTVLVCSVIDDLSGTTATKEWSEGSWSEVRGYPSTVSFYEQRLFFANTRSQPQTVWGSVINSFEDFTTGTDDDDAVDYTIGSNEVNAIEWLSASKVLALGTSGGVFILSSGSTTEPLTPTNVIVHRETTIGSADIMPEKIGGFTYFIQRNGYTVRQLSYDYSIDGYVTNDMTILSEHITQDNIVDLAYQQSPYNILWCVRDDGVIATLTRQIEQSVLGWSRQITDGKFESVAVIPTSTNDEVWFIVKRNINGSDVRYVEYLKPFDFGDDLKDAFFVDCGLSYDNDTTPITTVTGLDHLEGETIDLFADGLDIYTKTVRGNEVTIDKEANVIHAGLPYDSELVTLRLEAGSANGTSQGKKQRIYSCMIRLCKSYKCKLGLDDDLYSLNFDNGTLFSGDKYLDVFPNHYDEDLHIEIKQDEPTPLTVIGLFPKMETYDK